MNKFEPILFCFSGPAGSGKSTICEKLILENQDSLVLSRSTTSREPRKGEIEGVHYNFVSKEEFKAKIDQGEFIEYAEFSSNFYGTDIANIDLARAEKKDLILDIEVQGVLQLKKKFPENLVVTFVFPPSFEILEKRLRARGTESEEKIQVRLETAKKEIELLKTPEVSDYTLINKEIPESICLASTILKAERLKTKRI